MSEAPIKNGNGNAGATITPGKPKNKKTYWIVGIIVVIIIVVFAIAL